MLDDSLTNHSTPRPALDDRQYSPIENRNYSQPSEDQAVPKVDAGWKKDLVDL